MNKQNKTRLIGAAALLIAGVAAAVWYVNGPGNTTDVLVGEVVEIAGEQVIVEVMKGGRALPGDPVRIYAPIPGFDDMGTVGSGSVVAVDGRRVTAVISKRSGDLAVDQIVTIREKPSRAELAALAIAPPSAPPTVTSPPAVTSSTPGAGSQFEYNTNRYGSDYADFELPTADPQACFDRCDGDRHCLAWTFEKPQPGRKAHCWLKNPAPAPTPSDCCVSGAIPRAISRN